MNPFYVEVKMAATTTPPADSFPHLAQMANRIGADVVCEINGIRVYVSPGCDVRALQRNFRRCVRTGETSCDDRCL